MKINKPGWDKIDEMADEYSKLVTVPDGREIFAHRGRITKEYRTIDLRTEEQKKIANKIITGMVPYLRRQAGQLLNSTVRIGPNYVSRHSANDKLDLDDLVAAGMEGIMTALGKYRPKEGSFTTYSTNRINQQMSRAAEKESELLSLTYHLYGPVQKIMSETDLTEGEKYQELGRLIKPKKKELMVHEMIYNMLFAVFGTYLEFRDPAGQEQGEKANQYTYGEVISDKKHDPDYLEARLDQQTQKQMINRVLATLSPREEQVLRQLFYENKSQGEIGRENNLSGQRIQQIKKTALNKLRQFKRLRQLL